LTAMRATPAEVADSLADLRRINRWFWGELAPRAGRMVEQVAQRARRPASFCRYLRVAAGSGLRFRAYAVRGCHGRAWQFGWIVTLLDRNCFPRRPTVGRSICPAMPWRCPFRKRQFSTLVELRDSSHHPSILPSNWSSSSNEGLRVCRRAVLINDLISTSPCIWRWSNAGPRRSIAAGSRGTTRLLPVRQRPTTREGNGRAYAQDACREHRDPHLLLISDGR